MANTYKIKIDSVDVKTLVGDMSNVVFNVYYSYHVIDENSNTASFSSGIVELPEPDPSSFTNFEELTQSVVISWIENLIDQDQLKSIVDSLLDEKINPRIISRSIPLDIEDLATEETTTEETTQETV
jgi:hypothetical protein